MPSNRNVPIRKPLFPGGWGRVVVGDDGLTLTHRFAPKTGTFHGMDLRSVYQKAFLLVILRPGMHGQLGLIFIYKRQIADGTASESDGFFHGKGNDFRERGVG